MPGDQVELSLKMNVEFSKADERVEADRNRIAITRGPLIYCSESMDENVPVQRFFLKEIPDGSQISPSPIESGILKNIVSLTVPFMKVNNDGSTNQSSLQLIPYYAWNNRGNHSMEVWFPTMQSQMK
ncbi:hypothetical protein FACS189413_08330 [Bacteroidia bacterium]|nr:hypothetical protein FACS189413_08330 [Bacteroidia bacterium]